MSKAITTIKNKRDMSSQAQALVEGTFAVAKYDTEEACIYSYENATSIVDSWFERERDAAISFIRAKALMELKKLIMGDLWSEHLASVPIDLQDKWFDRMKQLDLYDEKYNRQNQHVVNLLKFANYNETSKLAGVKIVAPNQRQLMLLTEAMFQKRGKGNKASLVEVSKTYEVLAKQYNNGKPFKAAADVVEAFKKFEGEVMPKPKPLPKPDKGEDPEPEEEEQLIGVRGIFENEVGNCPQETMSPLGFPTEVMGKLPNVTKDQFKKFYRKVADALHPDKGGDADMMSILVSLNETMQVVFKREAELAAIAKWEKDYKQWKDDNDYKSEYVPESEVKG